MDTSGMMDLGKEYGSGMESVPAPTGKRGKKMIDYPTLYIRGKELPELPSGEFYFMCKGKKIGYRDPVDDNEEKSCEIAVMEFKPMGEAPSKMKKEKSSADGLEKKLKEMAGEETEEMDDDYEMEDEMEDEETEE
jgi:hypothetical protein